MASADDAMPQKTLVLPGEVFVAGGHTAFLLTPAAEPLPATGAKPWILYSPTLPGYPDMAEVWMHEQFTKAGVAVAGVDTGESYGSAKGIKAAGKGDLIELIVAKGQGHSFWEGFFHCQELVDFLVSRAKAASAE